MENSSKITADQISRMTTQERMVLLVQSVDEMLIQKRVKNIKSDSYHMPLSTTYHYNDGGAYLFSKYRDGRTMIDEIDTTPLLSLKQRNK